MWENWDIDIKIFTVSQLNHTGCTETQPLFWCRHNLLNKLNGHPVWWTLFVPGQCSDGVEALVGVLGLEDPLRAHLDLGPHDVPIEHGVALQAEQLQTAHVRTQCGSTEWLFRMPQRKWRETKLQPSTARSGHHNSCSLFSLHFLFGILTSHPVGCQSDNWLIIWSRLEYTYKSTFYYGVDLYLRGSVKLSSAPKVRPESGSLPLPVMVQRTSRLDVTPSLQNHAT